MISLPTKVTKTLYICVDMCGFLSPDSQRIHIADFNSADYIETRVLIGTVEMDFSIPRADLIPIRIEKLEAQKQKLKADTEIKLQELDEEIRSLLCIEHDS